MSNSYGKFAELYDRLTFDVDYEKNVDFIEFLIKKHNIMPELIFDMACGTGTAAIMLSERGYNVLAADSSYEMLSEARKKEGADKILFLNQPMQEFELYGTVDIIVCMLDSINYITEKDELYKVFSLCANYLNDGGLFIFDINSEYKFKNILANNAYCYEVDGIFYTWENFYDEDTGLCDFYLTFFEENEDSLYARYDEQHTERCYKREEIEKMLLKNCFCEIEIYDGYRNKKATETTERLLYCAKRSKRR